MYYSGKRQPSSKVILPACDTKSKIPKHSGANTPSHTTPQATLIYTGENFLNNWPHPSINIQGGKTYNIPKILTYNIPKIMFPPGRITNNKVCQLPIITNSLHNPEPYSTPENKSPIHTETSKTTYTPHKNSHRLKNPQPPPGANLSPGTQLTLPLTSLNPFFWSGLQDPKAYSLWGGVVPSPSIG